ncbi:transcription initiation factor TFIID subunit 8-like isoform X1 [Limulus polyphemus]|uniref:Transcription initiation factor TFIID subunit 8 n=2 Tax=Limulus polyphemus TaxID=6850 RepID=A0ABM1BMK8_LIMPO|nr:transcription initiation factor TFIID subunit 8-like isoform X1 [Limulus polyphemus]
MHENIMAGINEQSNSVQSGNARRKLLFAAVSSLCMEAGFNASDKMALETLTEMLQSCLTEIARSTHGFCELSGRTQPVVGDIVMALVEMGINIDSIPSYAKRSNRINLPTPSVTPLPSNSKILQAGEKRPLPSYIPEHYPPFPDPHAYIRTPTYKQPVTEYEALREKAASQKRDVERALTRFIAKTGDTHNLSTDDTNLFPLIACKPLSNPCLSALLPKDQVYEEESENNRDQRLPITGPDDVNASKADSDMDVMDSPYLRPVKMPKKRRR